LRGNDIRFAMLSRLIHNHPLANIAFVVVLVMGALAYLHMPRAQDPEINFNWVNITTVLPGASAEDVEKRVTEPLEDAINDRVADIRFISSSSREGFSSILVRMRDISPRIFDKRLNDLRREVQAAADTELPAEVQDPQVLEITSSNGFPTAMLLVTGPSFDERLRLRARQVQDDIERLAGVDRAFGIGLADPELRVEFAPSALAARGLSASDVADSVGRWFRDIAAGGAPVGGEEWLVRVIGQANDPDYLADVPVIARDGAQTPLDSVARVFRAREKPTTLLSTHGEPAIMFSVMKKENTNTLELVERIESYLEKKNRDLEGSGIRVVLLDDQTVPTRQAIGVMQSNALQGLALVFLLSWLFLGSRMAALVSLGIPFALAGTFWILSMLGHSLNMTVLLGAVIVLGMLVDDAVVILEDIHYRMQRGAVAAEAAIAAVRGVGIPVLTSVLTTLAAFMPLLLLPGILGDFMRLVPIVVSLGLLLSLVEAFWMLPTHVSAMGLDLARHSRMHTRRMRMTHWLRVKYARLLILTFRHARVGGVILLGIVGGAAGLVATGAIRTEFFALDPLRLIYVNVDLPPGAALASTLREVERVEAAARRHLRPDEARGVASLAGVKFTDTEPLYGDVYGQVAISLNAREGDMRTTPEVVDALRRDIEALASERVKISFTVLSGGPPAAKPIKIRVRGDNPAELRAAADHLKELVRRVPGSRDIGDDDVAGRNELVLRLDPRALKHAGLDPAQIARLVRLHVDGEVVAEMRDQGDKIEVRVKAARDPMQAASDLLDDPVALPGGGTTALGALVHAETASGRGLIRHYDLRRAITVEADLDKTLTDTVAANRQIAAAWEHQKHRFRDTDIDFSGELDDIQESLDAMVGLFLLGVGLIYLILAAQFKSYWQPFMILTTVPMAFAGVAYGLLLSGNPLSLYTMYGVIALTGVAVNAAIVLIDAANERRRAGMNSLHAAVYAARRRVIPILITTVTTMGGLLALALGWGGKSLLWGPMAASIVWGLGVSSALTLFVIPLMYWRAMRPHGGRLLRR
jgi:multidrug efflux pump subunit AcrB